MGLKQFLSDLHLSFSDCHKWDSLTTYTLCDALNRNTIIHLEAWDESFIKVSVYTDCLWITYDQFTVFLITAWWWCVPEDGPLQQVKWHSRDTLSHPLSCVISFTCHLKNPFKNPSVATLLNIQWIFLYHVLYCPLSASNSSNLTLHNQSVLLWIYTSSCRVKLRR